MEDADAVLELIEDHFVDASGEVAEGHPRLSVILEQIVLYPIKSCGAMRADTWKLTSAGLEMDRQFVVMRGRKAVTQKQLRYLCCPNKHSLNPCFRCISIYFGPKRELPCSLAHSYPDRCASCNQN